MNRYIDLCDGCSNTFFTTGSLFSLDNAACGGSCCRHGRGDCDKRITVQTRDDRERRHHQLISCEWRHRRQQWEGQEKRERTICELCATSIFWRYESKVVTRIFSRVKNVHNSINTRVSYVFYIHTETALCFIGLVLLTVWLLCYLQWASLKRLFAISGQVVFTKPNDFDERY